MSIVFTLLTPGPRRPRAQRRGGPRVLVAAPLLGGALLMTSGCPHDIVAVTSVPTPVLLGPVAQIGASPGSDPILDRSVVAGPYQSNVGDYQFSTDDNTPNVRLNTGFALDMSMQPVVQGNPRAFFTLDDTRVKAMLFVVGYAFQKTVVQVNGRIQVTAPATTPAAATSPSGADAASTGFEPPRDASPEEGGTQP